MEKASALPQLAWPAFTSPAVTTPPIGVGGLDLPDINVPQITLAPVQYRLYVIPPIPTWPDGLVTGANNTPSVAKDVVYSLLGLGG